MPLIVSLSPAKLFCKLTIPELFTAPLICDVVPVAVMMPLLLTIDAPIVPPSSVVAPA